VLAQDRARTGHALLISSLVMLRPLLTSLLLLACKSPAPAQSPEPGTPPATPQDRDADSVADDEDTNRDSDDFIDRLDRCPDDPGVAPDGCPIPDTDGDGLLDPEDKCPADLETKNGHLDRDGCPDEIPEDLATITGIIKGIQFEIDKDVIKPASRPTLDRAVQLLKQYPDVRIQISGHFDDRENYGRDLSRSRPDAVREYLMTQGIDRARIETRGFGANEPIDTNKTAQGRANNRRIEFRILVD
jgi:OOP family OmpA-OmpF porin